MRRGSSCGPKTETGSWGGGMDREREGDTGTQQTLPESPSLPGSRAAAVSACLRLTPVPLGSPTQLHPPKGQTPCGVLRRWLIVHLAVFNGPGLSGPGREVSVGLLESSCSPRHLGLATPPLPGPCAGSRGTLHQAGLTLPNPPCLCGHLTTPLTKHAASRLPGHDSDDSQPQLCFPSRPAGRGKSAVTLLLGNWTQDCPGPLSGGGKPGLCRTRTTASACVLGQDVLLPQSPLCCVGWEMECLRTLCP